MFLLKSIKELKNFIKNNELTFIYISSKGCNLCDSLKPKIQDMLTNYPKIAVGEIESSENLELTSKYTIFTLPAIIFFIDNKEMFREARNISVDETYDKLFRYYEMLD